MICLDTHAWYYWIAGDRRLPSRLRRRFDREPVVVSSASIWEIAQLSTERRIELDADVRDFLRAALSWQGVSVCEITPEIAVRAARLGPLFPRDPMDRLITATAIELGAPLATVDGPITESGAVEVLWD